MCYRSGSAAAVLMVSDSSRVAPVYHWDRDCAASEYPNCIDQQVFSAAPTGYFFEPSTKFVLDALAKQTVCVTPM